LQLIALFVDEQFRITDDVDEQDMSDLELNFGRVVVGHMLGAKERLLGFCKNPKKFLPWPLHHSFGSLCKADGYRGLRGLTPISRGSQARGSASATEERRRRSQTRMFIEKRIKKGI